MSHYSKATLKSRLRRSQRRLGAFLRRPSMRQQAKRLTEFQDSLEAEGYLRDYIHPILAGQPFTPEGQPDDDDFPIVCPNGCPGGSIGQHKFSCELARPAVSDETRFDLIRVHPYLWTRSEPRP